MLEVRCVDKTSKFHSLLRRCLGVLSYITGHSFLSIISPFFLSPIPHAFIVFLICPIILFSLFLPSSPSPVRRAIGQSCLCHNWLLFDIFFSSYSFMVLYLSVAFNCLVSVNWLSVLLCSPTTRYRPAPTGVLHHQVPASLFPTPPGTSGSIPHTTRYQDPPRHSPFPLEAESVTPCFPRKLKTRKSEGTLAGEEWLGEMMWKRKEKVTLPREVGK